MHARHLIYGLAVMMLAAVGTPGFAAEFNGSAQSAFVTKLAEEALLAANNKVLTSADRRHRLEGLLDAEFDMPQIARFVLGRYWLKASDTERQEFSAAFRDFMVRVYSDRFIAYSGETFRVIGQRAENATSTVVYTEISEPASGQPVKVEWRVLQKSGYRIVDMSIDGVSLALTKREEFGSYLQRSGGDLSALIRQLQVKMSAQQTK